MHLNREKYNPILDVVDYKCIELEHINPNKGTLNGYIKSKEQKSIKNKFDEDSILYGKLRPYLRKYYCPDFNGVCSSEILSLKPISNKKYYFYLLQSNRFNQLASQTAGSKMPRIDWVTISNFQFSMTSKISEIGNILSQIDNLNELVNSKLQIYKMILSNYSNYIFKSADEYKYLGELTTIKYGYTPPTKDEQNFTGDNIWYSVSDINSKYISNSKRKLSNNALHQNKLIPCGTLLLSFKLSVGRVAITTVDCTSNEAIANFTNLKGISTEYLYYALRNINIEKYGSQAAQGITLNSKSLSRIEVPIIKNKKKVTNFLSQMDKLIEIEEKKLEQLEKMKKYHLQQFFN